LSYDNEEENIDREYAYRPMPIDLSKNTSGSPENCRTKKYPWQLKIYIPQEHRVIFEKAKAIARREGRSLSDLIRDLLRDYVRVHEPGNPQLPLTRFTGESHDPNRCSVEGCDAPAAYVVHLEGRCIRVCMDHLRAMRREHKSLGWRRI